MSDVPTIRREASRHPFAGLAIAALTSSVACAGLLDLPSDPYVGEGEVAAPATDGPAREPDGESVGMAEEDEAESDTPATAASSPPSGAGGTAANAVVPPPAGTLVPTPAPVSAPSDPEQAPNAGEDEIEEPAPEPSIAADAGNDEPAPIPDAPPPPEPPRVACAEGETLGPRGTCYFVVTRRLSWGNARQNCRARGDGWDLGTIRSAADNRVVGEIIGADVWLGARDAGSEGVWSWVNEDTPFWRGTERGNRVNGAYEAWTSDEPNGGATSDCARAVPREQPAGPSWADFECEEQIGSLCEGPTQ
jgi:hypothetical protein